MIIDSTKELLYSPRRIGSTVLAIYLAGEGRNLSNPEHVAVDRWSRHYCGRHNCGAEVEKTLQGHPLLAMRHLFNRTEDC